jgi:hypothetical protein
MKHFILKSLVVALGIFHLSTGQASLSIFSDASGDKAYDSIVNTTPGALLKLSVYATEDGAHGGLSSYGVEIGLDPTLKIAGASDALQLANLVSNAQWDLPEGKSVTPKIEIIDGSFFSTYTGTVHLFDITLEAPGVAGSYTVSFKNVEPDDTFDGFVGFDGFVYDPSNIFNSTEINVVPIPGALPLFATALAGLGWQIRRRRLQ